MPSEATIRLPEEETIGPAKVELEVFWTIRFFMVVVPASRVFAPMLMSPNPVVMEPASSPPTEVSDEVITLEPRVVEFSMRELFIRKLPPVARLTLPPASEIPPEKVEVALLPTMVGVAVPPPPQLP